MNFEDCPENFPRWPEAMDTEELRAREAREMAFTQSLVRILADTKWHFSHGSMFRKAREWYVANLPQLAYEKGVLLRLCYKPMAIDPLFWDAMGMTVDTENSLPLRNQVPYVVSAPRHYAYIGADTTSEDELAKLALGWTDDWLRLNENKLDVKDALKDSVA